MINLIAIKEKQGWTKKYLADVLFPMNQHPVPALERILSGESFLDENQISLLATKLGVDPGDLFHEWKASVNGTTHTFTDGEYEAQLNLETMEIKFFVNGTLKHETVLVSKAITVSELITFLNKLR